MGSPRWVWGRGPRSPSLVLVACARARRIPLHWLRPDQIERLPRAGSSGRQRGVYVSRLLMEKQRTCSGAGGSWLALRKPQGVPSRPQHSRPPRRVPPSQEWGLRPGCKSGSWGSSKSRPPCRCHPISHSRPRCPTQLSCGKPSPVLGQQGCELWESGVSQEESGGPS